MKANFDNQTILITGGTRGIGKALVQTFATAGASIIATGTNHEALAALQEEANSKQQKITYKKVDFLNDNDVKEFIDRIATQSIDILVNNAGINKIQPLSEITPDDFGNIQKINVDAPFKICQAVIPNMVKKQFGRIVNISSIFGHITKAHRTSYSTSKSALVGLTKALSVEFAKHNILINCLSPGFIDTELTRKSLSEKQIQELMALVPINRLGSPDEIAQIALFLGSHNNTFITGQNIIADGGFTIV